MKGNLFQTAEAVSRGRSEGGGFQGSGGNGYLGGGESEQGGGLQGVTGTC